MLFTSGSTGTPKGIVIPHRAILDFTAWMMEFCGYTEDEVFGNQAPFYFDLSGKDVYQTLSLGASCRIFEKKYFTFPMLLLKAMEEAGVTAINWATSAFHLVAASGALTKYAPTHLKKAALGGEALQARYVNLWKAAVPGLQVVNMYGPTETTIDCAAMHLTREYRDDEPIPIGRACRNKQIILLKDDLTEVQPGEPGEICVRGQGMMLGYYQMPEKTADVIRDGWYFTHDVGYLDEDGYLYLRGRKDSLIISGGENIYPEEVIDVLLKMPEIAEAAVYGMPDPKWGEHVKASIVCKPGRSLTVEQVQTFCRANMPSFRMPREVEFLPELPKNATGKVLIQALKNR